MPPHKNATIFGNRVVKGNHSAVSPRKKNGELNVRPSPLLQIHRSMHIHVCHSGLAPASRSQNLPGISKLPSHTKHNFQTHPRRFGAAEFQIQIHTHTHQTQISSRTPQNFASRSNSKSHTHTSRLHGAACRRFTPERGKFKVTHTHSGARGAARRRN